MHRVSWLAKSDGMSGGSRVLTVVHNLNNNERRQCHRSLFGCHIALGDVAPGNPLVLMWPALDSWVTCRCHVILVVTEGGGEQG